MLRSKERARQATLRSWTTTEEDPTTRVAPPYPSPGDVLMDEFLTPMALSQYRLDKKISVLTRRIGEISAGKHAVTTGTNLHPAKFFSTSEDFWTDRQDDYHRAVTKDVIVPFAKCTAYQLGFKSHYDTRNRVRE